MQQDFSYDEEPKVVLAREVKPLQNKQVPLVKVLWQHHGREEVTWEPEATMRAQYPQLISSGNNFEDEILLREVMSVQNIDVIPTSLLRFSSILYINKYIIAIFLILGLLCIIGEYGGFWKLCGDMKKNK